PEEAYRRVPPVAIGLEAAHDRSNKMRQAPEPRPDRFLDRGIPPGFENQTTSGRCEVAFDPIGRETATERREPAQRPRALRFLVHLHDVPVDLQALPVVLDGFVERAEEHVLEQPAVADPGAAR